jgi:transposase-like protein
MGTRTRDVFSETLDRDYLNGLSEKEYRSIMERMYALMDSRTRECPFCGSSTIIRKGYSSNGVQRYACKGCGRGFIGNAVPYSHIGIDTWKVFCEMYLKGHSIHVCASRCGVCLKTAQYMKDRMVGMFREDPSMPVVFNGEMLLDIGYRLPALRGCACADLRAQA